jgi:hypothetical protein
MSDIFILSIYLQPQNDCYFVNQTWQHSNFSGYVFYPYRELQTKLFNLLNQINLKNTHIQ